MPVNVLQWCAGIGNFYNYTHPQIKIKHYSLFKVSVRSFLSAFYYNLFLQNILIQHGDIELNMAILKKTKPLSCCHWNVNSLAATNFFKNLQLRHTLLFTIMTSFVLVRLRYCY